MKTQQQIKRAMRLLKGLVISWSDTNPLMDSADSSDITDGKVTHKSPVLRLQADKIWRDFSSWITHRPGISWRIDFTVVFRYPNGTEQHEARRVVKNARLHDIAHAVEPHIAAAMRRGGVPVVTHFVVECLGHAHSEADYEDFEVDNAVGAGL